jgi:hypothetical protein
MAVVIRPYEERDERGWLICRLLSFFDTGFFDAVEREKERYERDAIELVADTWSGTTYGRSTPSCGSSRHSRTTPATAAKRYERGTHACTTTFSTRSGCDRDCEGW